MKNLIILLFSLLILFGCKKEENLNMKSQVSTVNPKIDTILGLDLKYVHQKQNGVFDTSSTSLKAALSEQQMFAEQISERTYQASLVQDRINEKLKRLQEIEVGIDSAIEKTNKLNYLISQKVQKKHEIYAKLE